MFSIYPEYILFKRKTKEGKKQCILYFINEIKNLKEISKQLNKLGRISYEEKLVAIVFALTAFAWVTRDNLLKLVVPVIDDTIIAMISAVIIFLLPTKNKNRSICHWAPHIP